MVVAYYRVSTDNQDVGIDVQKAQVAAACTARGWSLDQEFEEKISAKNMKRPELQRALRMVRQFKGSNVLIVSKLDRLSRSVMDFATLMEQSNKEGWSIVALDLGVDTTTPAGEFMATIISAVAQMERKIIGQRTKDALAIKIAQGVPVGKPAEATTAYVIRIARKNGDTMQKIADELNAAGIATAHGGSMWRRSSVASVLRRKAK